MTAGPSRPQRHSRDRLSTPLLLVCLAWALAPATGAVQSAELQPHDGGLHRQTEGTRYWVSGFELESAGPGLTAVLDELREREFALGMGRDGYVGPRRGGRNVWFRLRMGEDQSPVPIYARGIRELAEQVVGALNARGVIGAYVAPHPGDIDPATGGDLRPTERDTLRLVVYAASPARD